MIGRLTFISKAKGYSFASLTPKSVGVLGYGAIGKAIVDIIAKNHPGNFIVNRRNKNCC